MSQYDSIYNDPLPPGFVEKKPGKPRLYQGFEPGMPVQSVGWGDEGDNGDVGSTTGGSWDVPDPNTPQWGPMSPGASAARPPKPGFTGWLMDTQSPLNNIPNPLNTLPSLQNVTAPAGENLNQLTGGRFGQLTGRLGNMNLTPAVTGLARQLAPLTAQDVQGAPPITVGNVASTAASMVQPGPGGAPLGVASTPAARAMAAGSRGIPAMAGAASEWSKAFPFGVSKEIAQHWKGQGLSDEQIAARAEQMLANKPPIIDATPPAAPQAAPVAEDLLAAARAARNAGRVTRAKPGSAGPSGQPFRSVRGQVGRAQEQAATGVEAVPKPANKPQVVPAARLQEILQKTNGNPTTLVKHFAKVVPDMTPEQITQQMAEIRQADPAFFEKAGVPGLVTEAAASGRVGDTVQAKQSVAKAAQQVAEQRAVQVAEATGEPPKPPKKPPEVDTSNPFDEPDRVVVEHLPSLPPDLQDSVVSSLARGWQVASHVAGGAGGFAFGYNQDQNDDTKTRIIRGLLYGGAGFEAAHVVSGGKLTGLPNRAMEMYRRQLLSPSTVIVPKFGQDATSLVIAPIVRGIGATLERGPAAGMQEALKNVAGYWHGASMFPQAMKDALDMTKPLSTTYGEGVAADKTLASPGEAYGTLWTRLVQGVTQGMENMHSAGVSWANSVPLAKKEAELWKTTSAEDSIKWLQSEIKKSPTLVDEIGADEPNVADKIASGLWTDPEVGAFAQNAHVNQQLFDYLGTLPEPTQVAKDWTLTQPIGKGIKAGSRGQGGMVGRAASSIAGAIQDFPLLNPTIRGAQIPLGKMLIPFKGVVSNAADQFINFIPILGEINQRVYPDIRASTRIAKQVVGGATVAALLGIVGDGATDAGPTDPTARKKWLGLGNVANTFRGPDGRWYPIHVLPAPFQILMRTAGALNGYKRDGLSKKGLTDQGLSAFRDLGAAISDTSVFQSLLDLGTFMSTSSSAAAGAKREAGFMLGGLAGSNLAVPATAERPNAADTSGSLTANLNSRLPGIERSIPDRLGPTAKPMPNPNQGWRSLLGASAGKTPLTDDVAQVYYSDYGPGLNINRKEYGAGKNALPMAQDQQRATFEAASSLLQKWTPNITNDPMFKGADAAKKKQALSNLQNIAYKQAFWGVVNTMGKDKYLATLPDLQKSVFRSEDLANTQAAAIAKNPFQTRSGQPAQPGGLTPQQGLALQAKYQGMTAAQLKTKPLSDQTHLIVFAGAPSAM